MAPVTNMRYGWKKLRHEGIKAWVAILANFYYQNYHFHFTTKVFPNEQRKPYVFMPHLTGANLSQFLFYDIPGADEKC